MSINPKANRMAPCIISPNMTPNRNGKVMQVNNPGFAYLYLGMPYVSTIY